MRVHVYDSVRQGLISFYPLILIFGVQREPRVGRPEKITTHQIFFPACPDSGPRIKVDGWNSEISPRDFYPAKDIRGKFLINGAPVAPGLGAIKIIKKL